MIIGIRNLCYKRSGGNSISKLVDLTDKRFGKLFVLERAEDYVLSSGRKLVQWLCLCDCGEKVLVIGDNLKNGNTTSCGCYKKKLMQQKQIKHGLSGSRISVIYQHMKDRCFNKNDKRYDNYGGRGITICNEWLGENGFINFYNWSMANGYNDNLTIDRIDVNGNYEPSNCRWETFETQQNNRTNNHLLTYNGETMTMAMWAKRMNMNYKTLANRILQSGWTVEDALTRPVRENSKNK